MIELDLGADIAALRSTFNDIRSVIGVERLEAERPARKTCGMTPRPRRRSPAR
jgi:hypothetical protein